MMVSIITPCYNAEKFIESTIKTVLLQTYSCWELIIIDDNSSDNSVHIIKKYQDDDGRIVLLENSKNQGAAFSRNRGIKFANGRYIAFLDCDDWWYPNKLEVQINIMQAKFLGFSYAAYDFMDEKGNLLQKKPFKLSNRTLTYLDALRKQEIGCLTVIYDSLIIGKPLMPDIKRRQDYAYWLSILKSGHCAYPIPQTLATYRIRTNSVSSNKWKLIRYNWFVFYKLEKLGVIRSLYYTFNWAIRGFVKYYLISNK